MILRVLGALNILKSLAGLLSDVLWYVHALDPIGVQKSDTTSKHVVIAVGRFDSTFEMTVPDDAVDTQNASEPFDSDANASLTHERVHLTVPGGCISFRCG